MTPRVVIAGALAALVGAAAPAQEAPTPAGAGEPAQQPEAQPQRPQTEQREATEAERRAARRAWLVRRLEESRQDEARLLEMLARLDAGEPLPELRGRLRGSEGRDGRPDDRRRDDGRRGHRDGPQELSPEARAALVLEFADKHFPEFASRLRAERERNPEAAGRIAARFWPRVAELRELEQSDTALFAVEVERLRNGQAIMSAVWRARRDPPADEAARAALIAELRELASRQLELRLAATRLRLESLRQSVRRTEQELQEREAGRERGVEEQVERLLRMIDREDRGERDGRNGRNGRDPRDQDGPPPAGRP